MAQAESLHALGKYQLIAELGHGGMADVYLAIARGPAGFSKLQVIKQLRPSLAENPEVLTMFLDEARLAARLNHPNVVQTYEVEQDGARCFLAMEYLDGQPLDRIQRRAKKQGGLPAPLNLRILIDVLAGLHHAHELCDFDGSPLRVVHRDVSPQNVFVTYDGQIKVVDFGIAKAANASAETRTGVLKGKIAYMAPEQALGEQVDRRADLFAVGILLFEALSGRRFWDQVTDIQILHRLSSGELPSIDAIRAETPAELKRICARAMALRPDDRYATAAQFQGELEAALEAMAPGTTGREVGAHVATLFADKRAQARTIIEDQLRRVRDNDSVSLRPALFAQTSTFVAARPNSSTGSHSSAATPLTTTSSAPPPSRPPWAAIVGLGAGAVVVVLIALRSLTAPAAPPPGGQPSAPAVASSAPAEASTSVEVRLSAFPSSARLYLDGAALPGNPYVGRFPRDGVARQLRAEASGHLPKTLLVTFGDSPAITVTLDPEPPPAEPAASKDKDPREIRRGGLRPHRPPPPAATAPPAPTPTTPSGPPRRSLDQTDPWQLPPAGPHRHARPARAHPPAPAERPRRSPAARNGARIHGFGRGSQGALCCREARRYRGMLMKYRATTAALLATAAMVGAGCSGRMKLADGVRPADPTLADKMGEGKGDGDAGRCRAVSDYGQPLVVEWEPHQRANLEEALNDGVAVVSYDCKSLRLLRGCHLEGSYGFLGVSRKEEVIQFEDAEEIRANLPAFGGKLASSLGGELSQGTTLDLALVMVGKKRTTRKQAASRDLKGDCEGATHFIRGVFLGAFAMSTGSRGRAQATAEIFGAGVGGGVRSSKLARHRDGELDACSKAVSASDLPPNGCEAPLRLELIAVERSIERKVQWADVAAVADACPEGMVQQGSKCAMANDKPHVCRMGDPNDCQAQCERGELASCNNLGVMYERGTNGLPKDEGRAGVYYRKACEGNEPNACNNLGFFYENGRAGLKRDLAYAAALYKKGCDGSSILACNNMGVLHLRGQGGLDKDAERAFALFRMACDGGNALGCSNLGYMHEKGLGGAAEDVPHAVSLYRRSCQGDDPNGCGNLGYMYESGRGGLTKDEVQALSLYKRACEAGSGIGCNNLGGFYEAGRGGLPKDEVQAAAHYDRACTRNHTPLACNNMGRMHERGLGGLAADTNRAMEFYRRACDAGLGTACNNLKRLAP